jgi:hypothetical protein
MLQAWVEAEALAEEAAWRELDKAEASLRLNTSATSDSTAATATAGGTSITGGRGSQSAANVSVLSGDGSSRSQRVLSSSSAQQQQQQQLQQQQPRSAGFSPTHSRRLSATSSCCSDRLTEDCDRGSSSWGTVCEGGGSSEAGVLSKRELHRKLLR